MSSLFQNVSGVTVALILPHSRLTQLRITSLERLHAEPMTQYLYSDNVGVSEYGLTSAHNRVISGTITG